MTMAGLDSVGTNSLNDWRSPDRLLRAMADALILNLALMAGLLSSYTLRILFDDSVSSYPALLRRTLGAYVIAAVAVTVIALTVFAVSGMYTTNRMYCGRYKLLRVVRSVAVVFVGFGAISAVIGDRLPFPDLLGLAVAGLLCAVGMTSARAWSYLWARKAYDRIPHPDAKPERVLVIGGAGYIGSALIPQLLDEGIQVRLLDDFVYGDAAIGAFRNHPRFEVVRADFRRVDEVVRAMRDVDAVVHLGAIVGDPACEIDADATMEINVVATRMIAWVAKAHGVRRFVFASTCSVYGASDDLLDEDSALNPVSLYARTKIASETVLREMADSTFFPTILRFGTVYGLSGRTRFDLVVNLLSAKAVTDGKITVFGEDQWRPFVHVADAAKAVRLSILASLDVVGNETFSVGSNDQNRTLGEIGRLVHELAPEADLLMLGMDGDRRNYRVSFEKIEERLGFQPDWDLRTGIQQVLDRFAAGAISDYNDSQYSNVKYLTGAEGVDVLRSERAWLTGLVNPPTPTIGLGDSAAVPSQKRT